MSHLNEQTRTLLASLAEHDGITVHLSPGRPPLWRQDGALLPVPGWEPVPLSEDGLRHLLQDLLSEAQWTQLERHHELTLTLTLEGGARLHCAAYEHDGGLGATLRLQRAAARPPGLAELGAPAGCAELCTARAGLVVVSGPAGAGTSTTLQAMVEAINESQPRHVLLLGGETAVLTSRRALLSQRVVEGSTAALLTALRAAPRQGVDVVVIDPLPLPLATEGALWPRLCEAASAGLLVLVAVRAGSSGLAVQQLLAGAAAEAPGRAALAAALRGVVHQRLCRGVDGEVHAAYEVVLDGAGMLAALRDREVLAGYLSAGRRRGMQSLTEGLRRLQAAGAISEEEVLRLLP